MNRSHDPDQVKADAANAKKGVCPESGRDLTGLSPEAIRHHVALTFPQFQEGSTGNSDYERRARLILAYATSKEGEGK